MANPTAPLGSFPNYTVPFPYANLPAQLQASTNPPAPSNGSQYGRWNGVNNNAFGLFPSQWPSVFGSPTPQPMQFQPPWGNNGGSNQGPGSNPGMSGGLPPIPAAAPPGSQWIQGQPGSQQPPITPGMSLPPLNPGQSPFTPGLPSVAPAGASMQKSAMQPMSAPPGSPLAASAAATNAWGNATGQNVNGALAAQAAFQQAQAASRHSPGQAVADPGFNGQVIDVPWSQIGNFRLPTNLGNGPISLRFTTPSTMGDTAGMQFSQGQGQQEAFRLASLATQPGVFGTGPGAQGNNVLQSILSASPNFRFNIGGQSNAGTTALDPNTTYYMNLANRNSYGGPDMYGQNYGTNFDFTN